MKKLLLIVAVLFAIGASAQKDTRRANIGKKIAEHKAGDKVFSKKVSQQKLAAKPQPVTDKSVKPVKKTQ